MSTPTSSEPTGRPDRADRPRVAVLVTCLVDLLRPTVGFAAIKLLEQAGCEVDVPLAQTCCGQPAYNSGDTAHARRIASQVLDTFKDYDYVVVPSGSCAGMLVKHYPLLFEDQPALVAGAHDLAGRTYELTAFLSEIVGVEDFGAEHAGKVSYHDACSALRELGIKHPPRRLLANVRGLELCELADPESCCGFGGLFCIKYGDVSAHIAGKKVQDAAATGAPLLLSGDLGCLLNIAGRARRAGQPFACRHVAELLAGMLDGPAIGEARKDA